MSQNLHPGPEATARAHAAGDETTGDEPTATVADSLVRRLREWGVRRIFGLAGDGIDPIVAALRRAESEIELVTARHEEMAAFMATGHAKYTGEVGVCLATQGPGAIHLLTGLYDAKLDRKPVVAIVGQIVSTALGGGYQQEVDLHTLFKDVCGQYLQEVTSPAQLHLVVDNAVRTAIATSSPTCVIVPHDVQRAPAPEYDRPAHGIVRTSAVVARPRVVPQQGELERAAELLRAGRRPAVLVGQGAYGGAAEVLTIVDRLGAGLVTSLLGKPILDESLPFHCGVMGHLGTTAAADLLAACDTLLIVGSSDPWTEFYPPVGQARVVQIDLAARNLGAKYPVEVGLTGDTAETLRALAPLLPAAPAPAREWRTQVEGMVASWHDVLESRVHTAAELLNPQLVVHELSAHLPAGTQVAVDVGSVTYWYARFLRLGPDMPAHLSSTLASMGSAMPYGLAAKLHRPDRPVVALAGDGSMQMNGLSELITVAARWRQWADPRFVVLVLHNGDLAEVSWEQREVEGDPRSARSLAVPTFPYAGYAELLGLRGLRIGAAREVGPAWREAFASDRPCLVEAVVDPNVPLLPPRQAEDEVTQTIRALRLEGNVPAAVQLRQQRRQEAHHPAAGRP